MIVYTSLIFLKSQSRFVSISSMSIIIVYINCMKDFGDQKSGYSRGISWNSPSPNGGNSRKSPALEPSESSDVDFAYMDADVKFWGRPDFFSQ